MLLYRSPTGALTYDPPMYVVLGPRRVTVEEFLAGKLDDVILDRFGLVALVESLARYEIAIQHLSLESTAGAHAGRPSVQRTWSFGAGDARAVWIRGRTVSATAGQTSYEASFEVHLENGFPPALVERLGAQVIGEVNAAVTAIAPLPCMCHTNVQQFSEHGTLMGLSRKADPRAPVDVDAMVAVCRVCNQGWLFESEGDSHHETSYSVREFDQRQAFSETEVQTILADMRAGYPVTIAKSRGATTYLALTDGNFRIDEAEDNSGTETPIDEAYMREIIGREPDIFIDTLRKPLRIGLRDALYAATTPETRAAARDRLDWLLAYGPSVKNADLLYAFLAWPDEKPSPDVFAGKGSTELYHGVMTAIGYDQTNEAGGKFGVRVCEAIVAMMGNDDFPGLHGERATFLEWTGSFGEAVKELEIERAKAPEWRLDTVNGALDRVERKYMQAELGIPADDAEIEAQLRREKYGPPTPPDNTPWDFALRWPEKILRERVWPIASRLLEDDDVNIRGRALELISAWSEGHALTTPRLLEVAEKRPELFEDQIDQYTPLRVELVSPLCTIGSDASDGRRAAAIMKRLCARELLWSTDHRLAQHEPAFVLECIPKWGPAREGWVVQAARSFALYHRDDLIAFLEASRGLSRESREEVLASVEERRAYAPEALERLLRDADIPLPTKPMPATEELKRALDL